MSKRRAVFLDRDGVINAAVLLDGKPYPPTRLRDVIILPGVNDAMNALHNAGFLLIVVTNQPDVARGALSVIEVEKINDHLKRMLPIDEIRVCYHDDIDMCHCRKPLPGLLLDAAGMHGIDLTNSYMIGDRWRDIEAGLSAGCKTLFIDYGYPEKQPERADHHVDSLSTAATIILRT